MITERKTMTNEELIADATKVAAFMLDPDETTGMNKCGALIGQLIDALRAAEAREQKLREALEDGVKLLTHPQMAQSAYVECGDMYLDIDLWVAGGRRALGGEP
jgi:hypothetical protein